MRGVCMRLAYRVQCLHIIVLAAATMSLAQNRETDFPVGPQYLITTPSTQFLQPIATPSMSPSQMSGTVSPQTGQAEPVTINVGSVPVPANLPAIYWGWTSPGQTVIIERVSPEVPSGFPPGFVDVGVSAIVTEEWLREQKYEISLAEAARYWRTHIVRARRLYTNRDIERLH